MRVTLLKQRMLMIELKSMFQACSGRVRLMGSWRQMILTSYPLDLTSVGWTMLTRMIPFEHMFVT